MPWLSEVLAMSRGCWAWGSGAAETRVPRSRQSREVPTTLIVVNPMPARHESATAAPAPFFPLPFDLTPDPRYGQAPGLLWALGPPRLADGCDHRARAS